MAVVRLLGKAKKVKPTSKRIKLDLMAYLRYTRRYFFVASEVHIMSGIADVFAMKGGLFHEFEIKRTKADLKNDIKKKSGGRWSKHTKHVAYAKGLKGIYFCPHYFYFVVPENLVEDAVEFSKEHCNGNYGVVQWNPSSFNRRIIKPHMYIVKRPRKLLHTRHKQHKRIRKRLIMRMSSEIITLRMEAHKHEVRGTKKK